MIPKGLFTQIGMILVAVSIIMTYVQPEFIKIGEVQDSIATYQTEGEKVKAVNTRLAELVTRLDEISNTDQRKLMTYMPDTVDEVSIQRDLLLMTEEVGILYKNSSYDGEDKTGKSVSEDGIEKPVVAHTFALTAEGTYEQIKALFSVIEQNNYPLEVSSVNISRLEGEFLSVEIDFITYEYQTPVINE